MPTSPARPAVRQVTAAVAAAAALAVSLTACSDSKNGTGSGGSTGSGGPTGATTAPAPASSAPETHGSAALSKSEFITKMDKVCSDVKRQLDALPKPSSTDDFTNLNAFAKATLTLFPPYIAAAGSLVTKTADAEELTDKWLAVEESDFEKTQPLLAQMVDATQAQDGTKVQALVSQLQAAPDHSTEIAGFMTSYGLTDCAALESS